MLFTLFYKFKPNASHSNQLQKFECIIVSRVCLSFSIELKIKYPPLCPLDPEENDWAHQILLNHFNAYLLDISS